MAKADTLPQYLRPMMEGETVRAPFCVVCGATWPLNQHHVIRRGAGNVYRGGVALPKPTLTLCGSGNAGGCHGLAHSQRLHFRWVKTAQGSGSYYGTRVSGGHWEWLRTDEPTDELAAQGVEDGWERIHKPSDFD